MKRLSEYPTISFSRHLSFAVIGGYFAAYAILCRGGVLGSAQTMNLLELLISALQGLGTNVLLHIGALSVYVLGTMLTVLLPHYLHINIRRTVPVIDAAAAITLGFFPTDMPVLLALYPIFFAMSLQWSSFSGARGFVSSTIFSTNNTKQASLAFAAFLCDKDRTHMVKIHFYLCTLLCFHLGAAIAYFAVSLLFIHASFGVLPFAAWSFYLVCLEEKAEQERANQKVPTEKGLTSCSEK